MSNRAKQRLMESSDMVSRRGTIRSLGAGIGAIALDALLRRNGFGSIGEWHEPDGLPHSVPKAKKVIWLFMNGA